MGIQYERNDVNFTRNKFRVRGDVLEIFPADQSEHLLRVEFFGDEIDRMSEINPVTGEVVGHPKFTMRSSRPRTMSSSKEKLRAAQSGRSRRELAERVEYFKKNGKLLEAQRIEQRTSYDVEMLREIGFCSGIENYSRILLGREPGATPYTLLDYFPKDYLMFVDESHVTLPQVRGMYGGDRSRKEIAGGLRLSPALRL